MAQGIILAAGLSSRAQSNKLLFEIQGISLIEHAIRGMKPFVSHIFVITGHYESEISQKLSNDQSVSCVYNADYEKGMFSSIKTGVFVTDEDFFILPSDCPFVQKQTYQALLQGKMKIRVPSFNHSRGHPIWIDRSLAEGIRNEPDTSSLKNFRNRHEFETIEVNDPHVLDDIDTRHDYQKILEEKN